MQARLLKAEEYALAQLRDIPAPALVVYATRLEQNISLMRRYLESVVPGSGFQHLVPHVKTHKSSWVTRALLDSGVSRFKCTLNELDMLLQAGAQEILVAYPLLGREAERVAECVRRYPGRRFVAHVAASAHAAHLESAARARGVSLDCLIDLNVGYDRTGTGVEGALELAREATRWPSLKLRGIHAYAGHNNSADPACRRARARECMRLVARCAEGLQAVGAPPERIVVGGTPGFLEELRELVVERRVAAHVDVSPGTWVYWDSRCDERAPGMFEFAALLLAEVIDKPRGNLAVLNLGNKRWSVDAGPLEVFSVPGLEVVSVSEEHTVVKMPSGVDLTLGERILAAPRHVCPTVNCWESAVLVGEDGKVQTIPLPIDGRNR